MSSQIFTISWICHLLKSFFNDFDNFTDVDVVERTKNYHRILERSAVCRIQAKSSILEIERTVMLNLAFDSTSNSRHFKVYS